MLLHEIKPVSDNNVCTLIVEGARNCGQVLLAHFNDLAIDFTLRHLFDAGVAQHLAQHAAVPTANNQHLFGIRVRTQWKVCNHFLIPAFVSLCDLNHTVQHQRCAICLPVVCVCVGVSE